MVGRVSAEASWLVEGLVSGGLEVTSGSVLWCQLSDCLYQAILHGAPLHRAPCSGAPSSTTTDQNLITRHF